MKVFTKRLGKSDSIDDSTRLQRMLNQLKPGGLVPRGIYRFSSFKEADRWMIHQSAKLHVRQKPKILLKEEKENQSSTSSHSWWESLKRFFCRKGS